MASRSCAFSGTRSIGRRHTLRSSPLSRNDDNLLPRILPLLLLLSSFSILPLAYAQDDLHMDHVDSPPQECGNFSFTWSGGTPPYTFTLNATDNTLLRHPFDDNGTQNTTYFWNPVDISAGTSLFAEVKDSNGKAAFSGRFQILPGDGGCPATNSSTSSTPSSTSSGDSASIASSTLTTSSSSPSAPTPSSPSSSLSRTSSQRLNTGAVAGIAVGVVVLVLLAAGALLYLRRKRRTDRGAAGALFGGAAKYRAARNSAGPLSKATEQPVTFWNANLFVREKEATTQVRDSLSPPLIPRPVTDLGLTTLASRDAPSPHSKGDDELVSLVDPGSGSGSDSDSDASEVMSTRPSPPIHLSTSIETPSSRPDPRASAFAGHLFDRTDVASTTGAGGDADGRSHGSRP